MSEKEFLKEFVEVFDETDPNTITFETKFKELDEWSSLIVLSLIVFFEDECGVDVSAKQINESETVKDLFNLI